MTATDIDLDALIDALAARAAARARPLVNTAGDEITALAAAGLVVVNPGDLITSQWGNLTYGQTNLAFASVADRNNQWPTPPEGAQCVTLDTNSPWIYRAGAWHGRPLGLVASAVGPSTAFAIPTNATTTYMSLTVPLVAGRAYLVHALSNIGALSVASNSVFALCSITGYTTFRPFHVGASTVAGGSEMSGGSWPVTATATASITITLGGYTQSGTATAPAGSSHITVEDIGG